LAIIVTGISDNAKGVLTLSLNRSFICATAAKVEMVAKRLKFPYGRATCNASLQLHLRA